MSKHTRAPWYVVATEVYGRRTVHVVADVGGMRERVARVERGPTAEADARLIAAAPELLEALRAEEYAQRCANHPESQQSARVGRERADELRAVALAKAEGRER